MLRLLGTHFEGVDEETFAADLAEKNWVILLEDAHGALRGFSTLLVYQSRVSASPLTVVYSGDTIVDPASWGSPALLLTWLEAVRRLAPVDAGLVYWLLLTSGYRTYRFLPVFFREFVPRGAEDARGDGAAEADLLRALAEERFGPRYDPVSGIVRLARPQVLVPALLEIPEGRREDPHVAYFIDRNPGHVRGDELACLTRICDDNLTGAGRRIARRLRAD